MIPVQSLNNTADHVTLQRHQLSVKNEDLMKKTVNCVGESVPTGEEHADPIDQDLFIGAPGRTSNCENLSTRRESRSIQNKFRQMCASRITHPRRREEESPSTACDSSAVSINTQKEFD